MNFFVLSCDIIEPPENRKCQTNQIFDLLGFVEKIDKTCEVPHGRIKELLPEHALSKLKCCLDQSRQIRNLVAHHVPVNNKVMKKKQAVTKSAIATLEDVIRQGAERYQVDQVRTFAKGLTLTIWYWLWLRSTGIQFLILLRQFQPLKTSSKLGSLCLNVQFSPLVKNTYKTGHFARSIYQRSTDICWTNTSNKLLNPITAKRNVRPKNPKKRGCE